MKLLVFVWLTWLLAASCQNPKASIVDRQRLLKDSIDTYDWVIRRAMDSIRLDYSLSHKYVRGENRDEQRKRDSARAIDEMKAHEWRLSEPAHALAAQQNKYQREFDSLELELKKY